MSAPASAHDGAPLTIGQTALRVVWVIAWSFVCVIAYAALAQPFARANPPDLAATFLLQIPVYLVMMRAMRGWHAPETSDRAFVAAGRPRFALLPVGLAIGLVAQVPAAAIHAAILARFPAETTTVERYAGLFEQMPSWKQALLGLSLVGATPLIEEAFFRGALFGVLRGAPKWVALATTSLLFAAAHGNVRSLFPILLVGTILGIVRQTSGSIWAGVALHVGFNAVTFTFMARGEASGDAAIYDLPGWITALSSLGTLGLVALLIFLAGRAKEHASSASETP